MKKSKSKGKSKKSSNKMARVLTFTLTLALTLLPNHLLSLSPSLLHRSAKLVAEQQVASYDEGGFPR
jgi:hypothetical protein